MFEVIVTIKEDGKELIHLARSVEPVESTGLARWTKAPAAAAETIPIDDILSTLQLFFATTNQDDCLFNFSNLTGINLMRNGLILILGGSMPSAPLARITYNGSDDASIRFLGAGS